MPVGPVSGRTMPTLMDSAVVVEAAGLTAAALPPAGETAGLLGTAPEVAGWLGAMDAAADPPQAASTRDNNSPVRLLDAPRDNRSAVMKYLPFLAVIGT